jgi:predicted nucleic acid-binding protein
MCCLGTYAGHAPVVQRVMEYLQRYPQLELSVMSYYELRRGLVRIGAWRRIEQLEAFVQRCQVWEVSQEVAQVAAEIAGELAARGERLDDAGYADRGDSPYAGDWGCDG